MVEAVAEGVEGGGRGIHPMREDSKFLAPGALIECYAPKWSCVITMFRISLLEFVIRLLSGV